MADQETVEASPAGAETDEREPQAGTEAMALDDARKLRQEAASLRRRLKEAESKVQAIEDAGKSDLDKLVSERDALKGRADAAETALRTERLRAQVRDAAEAAGAHDPGAMWRMVDAESLDFAESGRITNLGDALEAVKQAHPRLFRGLGSADGGAGTNGRPAGPTINDALRQLAGAS